MNLCGCKWTSAYWHRAPTGTYNNGRCSAYKSEMSNSAKDESSGQEEISLRLRQTLIQCLDSQVTLLLKWRLATEWPALPVTNTTIQLYKRSAASKSNATNTNTTRIHTKCLVKTERFPWFAAGSSIRSICTVVLSRQ